MFRHCTRGHGRIARGLHGVDLDQLAVDGEELAVGAGQGSGPNGLDRVGECGRDQER
jgi:hypothetical protein